MVSTSISPFLASLQDVHSLTMNAIRRLSFLIKLFPYVFDDKFCETLQVIFLHRDILHICCEHAIFIVRFYLCMSVFFCVCVCFHRCVDICKRPSGENTECRQVLSQHGKFDGSVILMQKNAVCIYSVICSKGCKMIYIVRTITHLSSTDLHLLLYLASHVC